MGNLPDSNHPFSLFVSPITLILHHRLYFLKHGGLGQKMRTPKKLASIFLMILMRFGSLWIFVWCEFIFPLTIHISNLLFFRDNSLNVTSKVEQVPHLWLISLPEWHMKNNSLLNLKSLKLIYLTLRKISKIWSKQHQFGNHRELLGKHSSTSLAILYCLIYLLFVKYNWYSFLILTKMWVAAI